MATPLAISDIVIGGKYRCASKNDPSVKFKVSADSVDKKAKKVTVTGIDGAQDGKTMTVSIERLSRTQGRQAGFSPVAKTEKAATVKATAKSSTTAAKPKTKKAETEEMSLKSAKAEVLDISEMLKDLSLRMDALHTFLEGYKEEEEEEAEEEEDADETEEEEPKKPVKKAGTKKKAAPMSEDD